LTEGIGSSSQISWVNGSLDDSGSARIYAEYDSNGAGNVLYLEADNNRVEINSPAIIDLNSRTNVKGSVDVNNNNDTTIISHDPFDKFVQFLNPRTTHPNDAEIGDYNGAIYLYEDGAGDVALYAAVVNAGTVSITNLIS
jgi:hypothetical protein